MRQAWYSISLDQARKKHNLTQSPVKFRLELDCGNADVKAER